MTPPSPHSTANQRQAAFILSPLLIGRHFTPLEMSEMSEVWVSKSKTGRVLSAEDGNVCFYFWPQIMRQSQPHPGLATLEEGRESCLVLCIERTAHSHSVLSPPHPDSCSLPRRLCTGPTSPVTLLSATIW